MFNSTARQRLLHWFEANKRNLPWRSSKSAYKIWISEVILQQTRVAQGTQYFLRFMEKFPTVKKLAQAPQEEVLKAWEGLGYYARARNLHTAAKQVAEIHNGKFPESYEGLLSLKGIGPYTAAAIGSLAYNLPVAAVDGNVMRVLARLADYHTPVNSTQGQREITEMAQSFLNPENPGAHNEAVMELGAMVCTPKSPDCQKCPLQPHCLAHKNGTVEMLPQKIAKKALEPLHIYYLIEKSSGGVTVEKGLQGGIWGGLYQFPSLVNAAPFRESEIKNTLETKNIKLLRWIAKTPVRQNLTHKALHIYFLEVAGLAVNDRSEILTFDELIKKPFPVTLKKFVQANKVLLQL